MGINETLAPPEPLANAADIQATAAPGDAGYVYQRADGTVEHALNAADAIARCPVLGKLAMESPEQANVLLELAATFSDGMAAEEAAREQSKPKPEKPLTEQKPAESVKPDQHQQTMEPKIEQPAAVRPAASMPEHAVAAKQQYVEDIQAIVHQIELHRQRAQQQEALSVSQDTIEPDHHAPAIVASADTSGTVHKTRQPEPPTPNRPKAVQPAEVKIYRPEPPKVEAPSPLAAVIQIAENVVQPARVAETQPAEEAATETIVHSVNEDGVLSVNLEPVGVIEIDTDTPPSPDPDLFIGESETAYPYDAIEIGEPIEAFQAVAADDSETLFANPLQEANPSMDEQLELMFEPEIIEIYRQLVALPDMETGQPTGLETEDAVIAVPDFETFIATQLTGEEPVTLEALQSQANEQPLEQTLAQLIRHLSESETPLEQNILLEITREIKTALPACYDNEQVKPQITPEMTEKLLALLSALEYQNPGEVLVDFVRRYDIELLLRVLEHICQLNTEFNSQEFLATQAVPAATNDDTVRLRLGKVLFGLITRFTLEPTYN